MTPHTLPLPRIQQRPASEAPTPAAAITRLVRDARDRLGERRRRRRTAAELHGLSDATLKDIGLSRSEIDYVVFRGGSLRRPER